MMAAVSGKFTVTQKYKIRRARQPYPARTITTRSQGQASGQPYSARTTRDQGQASRGQGQASRGQGQASRNQGQASQGQGQASRGQGQASRGQGQASRGQGKASAQHGVFERLPDEMFDMILDKLSVLEISVFSMVSKTISNYIMDRISTLAWRNRTITQSFHHCTSTEEMSSTDHYRALGLLFKRCTLLLPTKDRLKFIFSMFSQVPCVRMERCTASVHCLGFSSYGRFLQTLIAGWDELECHRVFKFLCDFTNLPKKIQFVVTGKPGACPFLELQIRLFCRQVLLDPWKHRRDLLFWLTRILKPWPMVSQARLLFILYGPLLPSGSPAWQELLGSGGTRCALLDLAKAVILLYSDLEARDWTSDTVLAILEELTVLPQAWSVESVSRMLILCGNSICYSVLASKALNGRLFEISRLIVYLILICEKDGYCMNWSVKMVQQLCQVFHSPAEKWAFIQGLENAFSEVIMEMYEALIADNRHDDMEMLRSLTCLLNASAHYHTEILYMLLNDHLGTEGLRDAT